MRTAARVERRSFCRVYVPALDDAVFDGVDRGLGSRRDVELAEDAADMILYRLLAQEEFFRDLLVGQTECDETDNVRFPLRQFGRIAPIAARSQAAQHVAGKTRIDVDVARVNHQKRPRKIGWPDVFDDIALDAEDEAAREQILLRVHRQQADLYAWMRFAQELDCVYGIAFVEVNVEQHEIGFASCDSGNVAVLDALRYDVETVVLGKQLAQRFSEEGLLFDNSDANTFHPTFRPPTSARRKAQSET